MRTKTRIEKFSLTDDGTFPNSSLPVLLYRRILSPPPLVGAAYVKWLFRKNNWGNAWKYGIFTYHHYHSVTHEVLGVCKGTARIQLGGEHGSVVKLERGDVLIIPAGVAHKNLDGENDIQVVGAYPGGHDYDMNYGTVGERPAADHHIARVPLPDCDPVFGKAGGLHKFWKPDA